MLLKNTFFAIATACLPMAGFAGEVMPPPPTSIGDNDSTDLFVGLNWTFGQTSTLEGVIGVMQTSIDSSGDVAGGRISLHMDLLGRGNPPDIRLTGLLGGDDFAGELGVGLNLDGSGPFGVIGGIGNYWNVGATIGFGGSFEGYVGVHTFGDFDDKPTAPARRVRASF